MPEAAVAKATTAGIRSSNSASADCSEAASVPSSASPATAAITPVGASSTSAPKAAEAMPRRTKTTPAVTAAIHRRERSVPCLGPGRERSADGSQVDRVAARRRTDQRADAGDDHRPSPRHVVTEAFHHRDAGHVLRRHRHEVERQGDADRSGDRERRRGELHPAASAPRDRPPHRRCRRGRQ